MTPLRVIAAIAAAGAVLLAPAPADGAPPGFPALPRSAALGRAVVAELNGMGGMYDNPAVLSFAGSGLIMAAHLQPMGGGPMAHALTVPILVNEGGAIAAGAHGIDLGNLTNSTNGAPVAYSGMVAAGVAILPGLGIGASISGSRASGFGGSHRSMGGVVGIVYAPLPHISYAGVFRTSKSLRSTNPAGIPPSHLPDTGTSYLIGVSMRFPSPQSLREPLIAISLANEMDQSRSEIVYRAGIEVLPLPPVRLRAGYVLRGGRGLTSTGAGFALAGFSVDYAFFRDRDIPGVHIVSLAMEVW